MTVRPEAAARRRAAPPRRAPVDWRRYSARARIAGGRLPRVGQPLVMRLLVSIVFTLAGVWLLQVAGGRLGAGVAGLERSVAGALPQADPTDLVIGEAPVSVAAAPILDPLPEFTKNASVTVAGKVPGFALAPGRRIDVTLNGKPLGTAAIAPDGRFGPVSLALADGPNTVLVSLTEAAGDVASTSATVTVDRIAPALSIVSPKAGETVSGPDVIVTGKTESGASVILNDRVLRPTPDGSFTDRLTAVANGPLTLTVVATDKAGNETKTQLQLTVKPSASPAAVGTALSLTLDRTTVKPGETVIAQIVATDSGKPKADVAVTLQVGVITIGTYRTNASGIVRVGFAAPDHEVQAATVLVLGGGVSATTTLTVAKTP